MSQIMYATPIRITPVRFGDELYRMWKYVYDMQAKGVSLVPVSVLAVGEPGIGKSVIVREVAEKIALEYGYVLVEYTDDEGYRLLEEYKRNPEEATRKYFVFHDLRLTEVEPQDILGIPMKDEKTGMFRYAPPLWARILQIYPGVLFLDELLNVQRPDVMSASYPLLLDRRAGFIRFNPKVFIVAAGNPPEYSALGQPLATPQATRVAIYYVSYDGASSDEIKEAIGSWIDWMEKTYNGYWSRYVAAFLLSHTELFARVPKVRYTLEAYPCPRSWTFVSVYLYDMIERAVQLVGKRQKGEITPEEEEELRKLLEDLLISVQAFVGREAASMFRTDLEKNIVPLDVLLSNPTRWAKLTDAQQLFTSHSIVGILIADLKTLPIEKLVEKYRNLGRLLTEIERVTPEYYNMIMAYINKAGLKKKLYDLLEAVSPEQAKEVLKREIKSLRELLRI